MVLAEYLVQGVELTEAELSRLARLLEEEGFRVEPLPPGGLRAGGLEVRGRRVEAWGPGAELAVLVKARSVLRSMGFRVLLAGGRLAAARGRVRVSVEVHGRVAVVRVWRRGCAWAAADGSEVLRGFEERAQRMGLLVKRVRSGLAEPRKRIL